MLDKIERILMIYFEEIKDMFSPFLMIIAGLILIILGGFWAFITITLFLGYPILFLLVVSIVAATISCIILWFNYPELVKKK